MSITSIQDPNAKMIRELRAELAKLQSMLASGTAPAGVASSHPSTSFLTFATVGSSGESVSEQLETNKKLMSQLNLTWDEKISQTQSIQV